MGPLVFDMGTLTMYDGYNDEQEKEIMTTNPIDDLFKSLKPLIDVAEKATGWANTFTEGLGDTDGKDQSDEPDSPNYKVVSHLGLSDSLVLEDGSWQVVAIEEDAFDVDRVIVYLDNGENYSLIRTSLVWVL